MTSPNTVSTMQCDKNAKTEENLAVYRTANHPYTSNEERENLVSDTINYLLTYKYIHREIKCVCVCVFWMVTAKFTWLTVQHLLLMCKTPKRSLIEYLKKTQLHNLRL